MKQQFLGHEEDSIRSIESLVSSHLYEILPNKTRFNAIDTLDINNCVFRIVHFTAVHAIPTRGGFATDINTLLDKQICEIVMLYRMVLNLNIF